mgnify:FL=1
MGCQTRYGTIAIGAYMAHQPGTHQLAFRDQYYPRWDRGGARGPRTWKDKNRWNSLWSFGCRLTGGAELPGMDGGAPVGNSLSNTDLFEPFSCDGEGSQTLKFIKGLAVDASDVAISGANIQAFRTSDDAFAGYEVQSREDGSYDLATNFPGVNHYVVAYIAGSPDRAGTTVNTLVPANIDGT